MEITMKTTLLLPALAAVLLSVSTASFAHTSVNVRTVHAANVRSRVAARIGIPANAFNSVGPLARLPAQRPAPAAPPYDFQLSGPF
jgi:hypothetical protein